MTDLNEVKAGKYELVAELFDQPLSKPEDRVFRFKRYVKGDVIQLDEEEAKRLVAAGAVVKPGAREQAAYEAAKAAYEAAKAALPPDPDADPDVDEGSDDLNPDPLDGLDVDGLTAYATERGYDIGKASSVDGIRSKIVDAEVAAGLRTV